MLGIVLGSLQRQLVLVSVILKVTKKNCTFLLSINCLIFILISFPIRMTEIFSSVILRALPTQKDRYPAPSYGALWSVFLCTQVALETSPVQNGMVFQMQWLTPSSEMHQVAPGPLCHGREPQPEPHTPWFMQESRT